MEIQEHFLRNKKTAKRRCNITSSKQQCMLDNIFTDEETGDNRDVVLPKDVENAMK